MNSEAMTRRQFLKRSGATLLGTGILAGGYAWLWEPRQLDVTYHTLRFERLPAAFDGMKVVQFSDVHLGFYSNEAYIKRIMERIQQEKPDMICFTGDIVDGEAEPMRAYMPYLYSLQAPMGKFAVLGNHDFWGQPDKVMQMLGDCGFKVLVNANHIVKSQGHSIAIVGLDDQLLGTPDPDKGLQGIPEDMFTLLLMHEPDYADVTADYSFDIQLSGHSHGGQVRLPLLGALMLPLGSKRYIKGMYKVGPRSMPLYVNRGIGETHLPLRFMCKPELTVFTLRTSHT
ncbi:metallophosphoesterase [Paenibacillus pini]